MHDSWFGVQTIILHLQFNRWAKLIVFMFFWALCMMRFSSLLDLPIQHAHCTGIIFVLFLHIYFERGIEFVRLKLSSPFQCTSNEYGCGDDICMLDFQWFKKFCRIDEP